MSFETSDVRAALAPFGFVYHEAEPLPEGAFSMTADRGKLLLPVDDTWVIEANAYPPSGSYEFIEVGLVHINSVGRGKTGPVHRAMSPDALMRNGAAIVSALKNNVANEATKLTCPECKERWVHVKDGKYGPFLSCNGMHMVKKRMDGMQYKEAACRGILKGVPAVVTYR